MPRHRRRPAATWVGISGRFVAALLLGLCLVPGLAAVPERLTVVHSASWTPYSFLDADGQPSGMLIDLWRLFGDRNGVEVAFELVDWRDTFERVRNGQADAHGGLTWSASRETYLDFSTEVMRVRTLLFVPSDASADDLADMGDTPVGVVAASFGEDFIGTHFPDVGLRPYPNSALMVAAALRGEVGAFVADDPSGYYRLLLADAIGRFRGAHALYTSGIRVGVRKGDADLLRFIDGGFSRIADDEVEAIHERWAASGQMLPGWLVTAAIATVLTLCMLGLFAHYIVLQRMVRRRTADLNTSLSALEEANRELQRRASTDALTGIANRHTFYQRAAAEIERAKRYRRPLSLALFDLDHFKQINDRFGHLAGDAVLTGFASAVGGKLRDTDTFARFGGDEFVVLLPETRGAEAVFMVRRILGDLSEHRFHYEGNALSVSFSAGVAEYGGDEAVDDWLQRADSSLYRGKSSGRSVVTAGPGSDAASTLGAGP